MNYYTQPSTFSKAERDFQPRWPPNSYFPRAHGTTPHPYYPHPPLNEIHWRHQYHPQCLQQHHPPSSHHSITKFNNSQNNFPLQFFSHSPNQYVPEFIRHRPIGDEDWIRNFSEDCKRKQQQQEKADIKICDIVEIQREAEQLVESLRTTCEKCRKRKIELPHHVLEDKAKLDELLKKLSNKTVQKSMAEKITKRKMKRQKIKENLRILYYKKQQKQDENDRNKKEIEEWFEREQRKIEDNKREKVVQQELTVALHDIRKQQLELKNKMKKLNLLVKLKKSRQEKDGNFPVADELFDKCQRQTRELLLRATAEWQRNEESVKEFLSLEEDKKSLNEKTQKLKEREIQQWKEEREIALFGESNELDPFHEFWPLQELHKQTKTNFQSLINTRWQWDRFLHPEGTEIPRNFVEPPNPSNDEWGKSALDI